MLEGRFINIMDIAEKRKVCVMGSNSCKDLFKEDSSAIGRRVKLGNILYTVVGKYKTDEMFNGSNFYVPYTTLCTIYNKARFHRAAGVKIDLEGCQDATGRDA